MSLPRSWEASGPGAQPRPAGLTTHVTSVTWPPPAGSPAHAAGRSCRRPLPFTACRQPAAVVSSARHRKQRRGTGRRSHDGARRADPTPLRSGSGAPGHRRGSAALCDGTGRVGAALGRSQGTRRRASVVWTYRFLLICYGTYSQ